MKTLNITFTDKEHNELKRIRNNSSYKSTSWYMFILKAARELEKVEKLKIIKVLKGGKNNENNKMR